MAANAIVACMRRTEGGKHRKWFFGNDLIAAENQMRSVCNSRSPCKFFVTSHELVDIASVFYHRSNIAKAFMLQMSSAHFANHYAVFSI